MRSNVQETLTNSIFIALGTVCTKSKFLHEKKNLI